jgi:hypothetical protein
MLQQEKSGNPESKAVSDTNTELNVAIAFFAEVARTRLREEGSRYKSFWPCLMAVYRTEGRRGLYRGLVIQLIRQIPNTAIMMSTYELSVHFLTLWLKSPAAGNGGGGSTSGSEDTLMCKSSHSQ